MVIVLVITILYIKKKKEIYLISFIRIYLKTYELCL